MADRMNGRTSPADGAKWVPLLLEADGSLVTSSSGASAAAIGAAVNTLPALTTKAAATLETTDWEVAIAANADREAAYIVNTDPLPILVREGSAGTGEELPSGETAFAMFRGTIEVKGAIGQTYDKAEG